MEASLGKPSLSTPTSVVVPPMSTTMASRNPERKAPPRMLLVGPEENVSTGYWVASSALGEREERERGRDLSVSTLSLICIIPG